MNAFQLSLYFLLTGSVLMAEPTPPSVPLPTVDSITEVLPILQSKYFLFHDLQYKPGDHLSDLIARSKGGITLSAPDPLSTPNPIVTATLPGNIIYWRLASFTPEKSWPDLGTQLEQARGSVAGIILDLRSNVAPDDYPGAAQVSAFFAHDPAPPFLIENSSILFPAISFHPVQPFYQPVVVLINHKTTGAAEALAESLKHQGALVMGQSSAGKAAFFEQQRLASGHILRYLVAPVCLPHGKDLFGYPVNPDISLTINDQSEKGALIMIRDNHILDVIQESAERHRLNEASLVQGQDPEWDDYLASLESKAHEHFLLSLPPIHDTALVSAIDSLKAIRLSQRPTPSQPRTSVSTPVPSSIQ